MPAGIRTVSDNNEKESYEMPYIAVRIFKFISSFLHIMTLISSSESVRPDIQFVYRRISTMKKVISVILALALLCVSVLALAENGSNEQ